jgi:hypothetical protein
VKALSLWQPWATAIARGAKKIETRGWATKYRGPLLIHAARTKVGLDVVRAEPLLWAAVLAPVPPQTIVSAFQALPFGALVARCELVDCVSTNDVETLRAACRRLGEKYSPHERELGNYDRGRWAWLLRDIRPLAEPVPMRAFQGLFEAEFKEAS